MALQKIVIRGGRPLSGRIPIEGAKNAALPLLAAALLTDQTLVLTGLPRLADIASMTALLEQHGVQVAQNGDGGKTLHLSTPEIASTTAPYDLVRKMRASVLVLGPLVARCGTARVSMPGGCAIGTRPIDLHLKGLEAMGAEIHLEDGYVVASAPKGLKGGLVRFPFVSVGATENILMAACLARGETILENAAREPEITDLAHCLIAMGAEIEGVGTERLVVRGRTLLHGATHKVVADRIEAGTYAMAVAATGGRVELVGAKTDLLGVVIDTLARAGVEIEPTAEGMMVTRGPQRLTGVDVMTQPFPGFPTDMQAQMMVLMATAEGAAMITETIFENRFMHVPELARMGADITVHGASALVRGVKRLSGAPVMATDLRASVSLVLAGLAAEGETTVNRVYHLDRGYERLEEKLAACGARIERVSG
ncbi:UDP-N-acetylglucosamine 1-carboxyvinyltransferase [Zavarzinia sp. CC-PAN008]|uniref:UDP-N-acetylglucosamine 1-carboxyvinyltransferase n=1 Tax=Zavarzinia sp. CC-PAN008 TaxID=3243332 RepID=UPI003F747E01